jgi:peptide/nickel transport system substrate-binding protein
MTMFDSDTPFTGDPSQLPNSFSLSRRDLLRRGGALGVGTGVVALLAACGSSSSSTATTAASTTSSSSGATTPTTSSSVSSSGSASPAATTTSAATSTTIAAATTSTSAGAVQKGGKLSVALNSDLTTMDPHLSTAAVDRQVFQLIYDKLVDIDEKLNIIPELATKWDIATDGQKYTFHLVSGVTFHDGDTFNATAVKANFTRMLDKATASPRLSEISQVTQVDATDDQTLTLTLSQPYSPLLATLSDRAGMIISPKAITEKGADLKNSPVGCGAFIFVEWITGDHLTVKKNDNYWQKDLPYLDQVIYKPVTDATVRLTSLQSNEVQMIDQISAKDVARTQSDSSLKLDQIAALGFNYISLNQNQPPFDKKELRQAIAWTIDRDSIIKSVLFGIGKPAQTPIPPNSWAYDNSVQIYKQDYDKAKQMLAAGGQPNGFEFSMLVTNSPDSIQLAEAFRSQMMQVGITAKLELLEFATLLSRSNAGNYQAVSLGWSGRPDPDGNIYNYFHTDGGNNRGGYSNPDVDKLLEQTRAESDPAKRKALYTQVTTLIAQDAPMIFFDFPSEIKTWRPVVQGFVHVPDGMMRFDKVWLKK